MSVITIAQLIGVPALCFAVITWVVKKIKQIDAKNKAVMAGMQALLRGQMISEYNKAKDRGYAPIYAKDNFQNLWDNYHNLGANGVMDGIKDEFLAMPSRKEDIVNE